MSDDPHGDLRRYLTSIGAPEDAYAHIVHVIGWQPLPIWEAPHAQAAAINQTVKPPAGMRHVGWYCEHPRSAEPPYERLVKHRRFKNNKRGWTEDKNVSRSISFGDYDADTLCPQRLPVYTEVLP
jgi:hypothetical protein